ncbi:hypothetical protein U1Q18_021204 [Sarracenia purpurea var. burkii]
MERWWSLGSAWWEKLSRNLVPVQCTKVIFVPPWEGFSANSTRLSIMASITGHDRQVNAKDELIGNLQEKVTWWLFFGGDLVLIGESTLKMELKTNDSMQIINASKNFVN